MTSTSERTQLVRILKGCARKDFLKSEFEELIKRRFFYAPSFHIYGGFAGLYDYGPPGCAVKNNILSHWRQHFVLTENMLEIEGPSVTPDIVLKASGHVDKFTDLMVKDVKTGDCYRADHIFAGHLKILLERKTISQEEFERVKNRIDDMARSELYEQMTKYQVVAPDTNNAISEPFPFNLMFATQIGPTGKQAGFLRPETAQGIFVNFKRLLDYNGGKLPFASAQIGPAFRNEIAPRSGLLRVREFTLAEIEHFVDPDNKKHPKFASVANLIVKLYSRDLQLLNSQPAEITIGEAVERNMIANETLAYFMARTHIFLESVGILKHMLRFRQHLRTEMAHYATDCWDAEIETTYGWVECVGIADRACYDLKVHTNMSGEKLVAFEAYDQPRIENVIKITPNKALIGKTYKSTAKTLFEYLDNLGQVDVIALQKEIVNNSTYTLKVGNDKFELNGELVQFVQTQQKINGKTYTPSVIEPSFGVGRIIYAILEHSFWMRDQDRGVLSLKTIIAPVKCSVLPLSMNEKFTPLINIIDKELTDNGISHKIDDSGASIGKRYARTDEIGIPFGITIDFASLNDNTVTLRERDSTLQIRANLHEVVKVIKRLADSSLTWEEVQKAYPAFDAQE
jgi:glycyl-tRNA synthetase